MVNSIDFTLALPLRLRLKEEVKMPRFHSGSTDARVRIRNADPPSVLGARCQFLPSPRWTPVDFLENSGKKRKHIHHIAISEIRCAIRGSFTIEKALQNISIAIE